MAAHETVLITGATGLFGRGVIARLLQLDPSVRVVALLRDSAKWDSFASSLGGNVDRVSAVYGDIRCPGLGIDADARRCLDRVATSVVHLAADTTFSQPLEHARSV